MVKRVLVAVALSMSIMGSAFAEQPMANQYRQVFQSGNFLLDYEATYYDADGKEVSSGMTYMLAAKNNMRMNRLGFELKGAFAFMGGGSKDYPDVLYRDGKYYRFTAEDKATMATRDQIKNPNIDPKYNWNSIQYMLAVPEEFFALYPNDPYKYYSTAIKAPSYAGSSKKTIGKKNYDCDTYVLQVKSQSGNVLLENVYNYYYGNGNLAFVDKLLRRNGQERKFSTFEIKKMTNTVDDTLFTMPKGCKVYAVGMGDMNDLIEQPVQIETY